MISNFTEWVNVKTGIKLENEEYNKEVVSNYLRNKIYYGKFDIKPEIGDIVITNPAVVVANLKAATEGRVLLSQTLNLTDERIHFAVVKNIENFILALTKGGKPISLDYDASKYRLVTPFFGQSGNSRILLFFADKKTKAFKDFNNWINEQVTLQKGEDERQRPIVNNLSDILPQDMPPLPDENVAKSPPLSLMNRMRTPLSPATVPSLDQLVGQPTSEPPKATLRDRIQRRFTI
jgi:hypothetical protein